MFILTTFILALFINNINAHTCCRLHKEQDSCEGEAGTGSPCVWLNPLMDSQKPLIDSANGDQCVGSDWAVCKAIDIEDECVSITDGVPPPYWGSYPPDCGQTVAPTSPPTFEPCTADYDYNLQFIIDESGSVTWYDDAGYTNTIDFVVNLIQRSVAPDTDLSALAFSFHTDFLWPFSWADDNENSGIISILTAEKDNYAKSTTDTYNALIDGITDFEESDNILASDNNLMILITDGQPYCANGQDVGCVEDVCSQTDLLDRLAAYNVRIILVGITSGFQSDSLDCLCDYGDIYEFEDFTPDTFRKIEAEMREILCPATIPAKWHSGVHKTSKKRSSVNDHQNVMARKIAYHSEKPPIGATIANGFGYGAYFTYGIVILTVLACAGCLYWRRNRKEYTKIADKQVSYGTMPTNNAIDYFSL